MFITDIDLGSQVELEIKREDRVKYLRTKVESSLDNGIIVAAPMDGIEIFDLKTGDSVSVLLGKEGKLLKWKCDFGKIIEAGRIKLLPLFCEKEAKSFNRRNAFRVPYSARVTYKASDKDGDLKGTIFDISFLGIGIASDTRHDLGTLVTFNVSIFGEILEVKATIVRREDFDVRTGKFRYGAAMESSDESLLSKLVCERQRDLLAKMRR